MDVYQKIMTLEQAVVWHDSLKRQGKKLVLTNGVFDLLHRGHVTYLNEAAKAGDALLVAINSDESVHELKGPTRPVVSEEDRAFLLASLSCVDAVVIFNDKQATAVHKAILPEIYVKGGDYTVETLARDEYQVLKTCVEKFIFIPFVKGHSTTETIRHIRGEEQGMEEPSKLMNPKLSVIFGRRSVRKFQDRLVDDARIMDLLQAAMAAPSACGKQTWKVIVLKSEEKRKRVAEILRNGRFLAQAPLGFIVCGDTQRVCDGEMSFLLQDCSAAVENLLIAARALSLGACWLGIHPRQERINAIRSLFMLPEGIVPVAAVAVGWPGEEPLPRSRFCADDVQWV